MSAVVAIDDGGRADKGRERPRGPVTVVVIAYDDAGLLPEAVASALAQGAAVGEVVVVDDASTDGTAAVADRLDAADPRVRVIHRTSNSGGCGTPRNDGLEAARGDWIAFLDSDDVLPGGAVDALLAAARRHRADVAAGLCMRRELPERRETPWQPELFAVASVHDGLAGRPETVWDTLSVNKLYRRDFLTGNRIRFPDGAAHYEDFVFTGQVYAAAPRFAVIPDLVYVWHARPGAAHPSISLRRDRIGNWHDRIAAHQGAVEALAAGGEKVLAVAAQTKFIAYDLPMYLRDLRHRSSEYRRAWWGATREHLAAFAPEAFDAAAPADRWRAAVVLARADVDAAGIGRTAELSAEPPRLAPPYAGTTATPLWDDRTPDVPLTGMAEADLAQLPLCVSAEARPGRRIGLRLCLVEMYGRVAAGGPDRVEVELRHRVRGTVLRQRTNWTAGGPDGGDCWRAAVSFEATALRDPAAMATWDAWATVVFRSGERVEAKVRAGGGLGRTVTLAGRGRVLLVQPYGTTDRSLAIRVADGAAGLRRVVGGRLARLRRS